MELWQMDLVGGFLLADGSHAKALAGVDDQSRFYVSARLMPRERTRPVCDGLLASMAVYVVPRQILTFHETVTAAGSPSGLIAIVRPLQFPRHYEAVLLSGIEYSMARKRQWMARARRRWHR